MKKKSKVQTTNQDLANTAINKRMFLSFYEQNRCNHSKAARLTGVSREVIYDWQKNDPQFVKDMQSVYEGLIDQAEEQLTMNIEQGKETSLIFYLANKGKVRGWQSINKVEMSGTVKIEPITIVPATPGADKGVSK